MKSGLEARVVKLEQSAQAGKSVWVQRVLPDGSIKALSAGEKYASHVVKLPEVCESADEWLRRYAPKPE